MKHLQYQHTSKLIKDNWGWGCTDPAVDRMAPVIMAFSAMLQKYIVMFPN